MSPAMNHSPAPHGAARTLRNGLIAGLVGTAAEVAASRLGRRLNGGRTPVYAPPRMAGRLARRYLGWTPSSRQCSILGTAMRWSYGPSWGAVASLVSQRLARPGVLAGGAMLGATISGFEFVALPVTGATPPLREWGVLPVLLDAFGAGAYGLTTAAVLAALHRDAPEAWGNPHPGSAAS